ncbi:class I SAM-dependent methyltransferase [Streptacidiphilus pinicola]|nr:class I SAM-dependent methyltransferase [Streptacidiphilus pinicola]
MVTENPPRSSTSRPAAAAWALGDYPAMARRLEPVADRVLTAAGFTPGMTLLDVGCGTGNAALAAARLGAAVTMSDPTPELLALAVERARVEGLTVEWRQTDAEELPGVHDRVVSVFGAMYAPDADKAAAAMLRACSPDGRIVLAAWTPDGLMATINRAIGPYLPPPPVGAQPPTRWGDPDFVRALFDVPGTVSVTSRVERHGFSFASASEAAAFWLRTAGHVQAERPRLEGEGRWQALHEDLAAVFPRWNRRADDPHPGVLVESAYLITVVDRKL